MVGGLMPYPKCRPSRLKWVGKIPSHWEEKRAKYYFREVDERSATGDEELLSVSHVTGVTPRTQKNVTMFKAESYIGHKVCQPGDLVINTMWAWMAAMGTAKQAGITSPSYGVYRPLRLSDYVPEYADHLLRTKAYASEYFCRSTGIRSSRLRLYPDDFLDIPIVCPPRDEQRAMLAYLKTKILEIHHFIHNKQRLIELLQEQKQAIISHAVTRGIDPDVRLKPSGIDWLGDVPEHWDVLRIKNVLREVDRRSSTGNETLLSMTRRRGLVRYDDISEKPASAATLIGYKICEQEEVVMNRMQAWSGMFHVAPERGLVSPDYAVFAPVEDADTAYLGHLLRSPIMVSQFVTESKGIGSGFLRLYTDRFGAIPMPLPSRTEQIDIVLLIQDKSEEIDAAIVHTRRQIDLIREYRTRLIADVVTGKLDVRDVAIDEAAEADAPDDNGFLEDEEDSFMSAGKEYADDA